MLSDLLVTRFPNGVGNQAPGSIFASVPFPLALGYHVFDEDFYTWTAGQWTETDVAGANTVARADGDGGLVAMTTGANNNDGVQIQRVAAGISGESWLLDPDKKFVIDILATLDVLTASAYLGLAITDTSILGGVTDGLAFRLATGGALTLVAEKDSVEATSASLGTITAATQFRLSAYYDGQGSSGRLYGALDGTVTGYVEPGASFPDNEALTVSFALQTLTAAAKVLTLDRVFIATAR